MSRDELTRDQMRQIVKFSKQLDFVFDLRRDIDTGDAFWKVAPAVLRGMREYLQTLPPKSLAHRKVTWLARIVQNAMANPWFGSSSGTLGRVRPTHTKAPGGMLSARPSGLPTLGKRR